MNKYFILIALGSASLLFAGPSQPSNNQQFQPQYNGMYSQTQQQRIMNQQISQNTPSAQSMQRDTDSNRDTMSNSDEQIDKIITDKLKAGWFSKGYEGVEHRVYNGNVLLNGTTESLKTKNEVENIVKNIPGVKQINNQIVITNEGS